MASTSSESDNLHFPHPHPQVHPTTHSSNNSNNNQPHFSPNSREERHLQGNQAAPPQPHSHPVVYPHFGPPPLALPQFDLDPNQFHANPPQNHNMIANSINDFNPFEVNEDHPTKMDSDSHQQPILQRQSSHSASSSQDSNSTYNQSPFSNLDPPLQGNNSQAYHPNFHNSNHFNSLDPSGLAAANGNGNAFGNGFDFSLGLSPNSLSNHELHSDITNLNEWSAKHLNQLSHANDEDGGMFMGMQGVTPNFGAHHSSLGLGQMNPNNSDSSPNSMPVQLYHQHQFDPSNHLHGNPNLFRSPASAGNGFLPSPSFGTSDLDHMRSTSLISRGNGEEAGSGESGSDDLEEDGVDGKRSSSNKRAKVAERSGSKADSKQRLSLVSCTSLSEFGGKGVALRIVAIGDDRSDEALPDRLSSSNFTLTLHQSQILSLFNLSEL